jgi:hypothetical protein
MAFEAPLINFMLFVFANETSPDPTEVVSCKADGTRDAKAKAMALAKDRGCNVDLAYAGDAPFNERYISTAQFNSFSDKWETRRLDD